MTEKQLKAALEVQMRRARVLAEASYSMTFANDPALLKFLLDRLERVEKANSKAYETIRAIDWAL